MDTVNIPKANLSRNGHAEDLPSSRHDLITKTLEYRAALFDFADGHITWHELIARHQAVRLALRESRRVGVSA